MQAMRKVKDGWLMMAGLLLVTSVGVAAPKKSWFGEVSKNKRVTCTFTGALFKGAHPFVQRASFLAKDGLESYRLKEAAGIAVTFKRIDSAEANRDTSGRVLIEQSLTDGDSLSLRRRKILPETPYAPLTQTLITDQHFVKMICKTSD